jgi:hypothetical protein
VYGREVSVKDVLKKVFLISGARRKCDIAERIGKSIPGGVCGGWEV